ncbi:MAG: TIGR04282 family arsenosugar biosynthesis glycosyltransferase [Nitrospirae bacterium]|nr:TIGR04282 family arsenosugar biosynthesis glycosyltransferase [Nitrospirota bacterium]
MRRSADHAARHDVTDALVVFAKAPEPGRVKTRLIPPLTPRRAVRLSAALLRDTLRRVTTLPFTHYLACAPTVDDPFFRACARRYGAHPISQGSGNLGMRMRRVVQALLGRHSSVLLIGTDSPTLPLDYIERARIALETVDLVFGPSEDGGYYLLGQRCFDPRVFVGIPWGSAAVLETTLAKVDPSRVALLPSWYDVDRPSDLERLRRELAGVADAPHTRALLRSWERRPDLDSHQDASLR